MIVSIVRELHFTPSAIDQLYLDNQDHHGLVFWYEDCKAVNDELKRKARELKND